MNQRDEELHSLARSTAAALSDPDRKQLRFNDIVRVARAFYYNDPASGIVELVRSCDRSQRGLYVAKQPMRLC